MPPLADPVGDGGGIRRYLKALAERLRKALQRRAGQLPDGGQDLLDGGRIEGLEAHLCRELDSSAVALRGRCVADWRRCT